MKVKFNVNLGSRDAHALGLDYQKCKAGAVADLSEAQVEALKKVGKCVVTVTERAPAPVAAHVADELTIDAPMKPKGK